MKRKEKIENGYEYYKALKAKLDAEIRPRLYF